MPDPIRIFLSSPGDLNAERRAAEAIIESLRRDPLLRGRHLEIVSWDSPTSHLPMLAQYTPQQIVDMGLPRPSQCDVVLVMFWSRMGTPLDEKKFGLKDDGSPYWSGTEWEYLDAIRRADAEGTPAVLLYRRMDKVLFDADDAEISKKQAQYQRVKDFFAALHDPTSGAFRRSYNTYTGEDGFKTLFEKDLRALVGSLLSGAASARTLLPPSEPEPYTGDPYPGLLALTPAQAGIFFGRGEETQRLIDRLRGSRFVGVVGASGSGKSSLVGAGMIPKLRNGAIDGSQTWLLPDYDLKTESWMGARFTPTTDPFTALASRIARLVKTKEDHLAAELAHTPESPAPLLAPLFEGRPASCELLLFIDQFEELMTLSLESRQKPFARLLAALAEHPRVRTVVTLRADFLDHCLNLEPLQPLLREPITVGPPSPIALAQMVEGPARKTGLHFDPSSLPERIVVDVGNEKGGLALLAYALSQLYAGRKNNHLTEVVYDSFGGVQKAIGTKAQAVYDALDPVAQAALTPLFGQLVTVTRDGEPTRRRMTLDSLLIGAGDNRLLQRLIDERLLVSDEGTVEVAHEALFRHWPALVEWINRFKGDLYLLDEVRRRAKEWDDLGRPTWYSRYRHEDEKQIEAARAMLQQTFNDVEQAYLQPELERLAEEFKIEKRAEYKQRIVLNRAIEIGADAVKTLFGLLADSPSDGIAETVGYVLDYWYEISNGFRADALKSYSWRVKLWGIQAVHKTDGREFISLLRNLLSDSDWEVRQKAASVLGEFADLESVSHLRNMLEDANPYLQYAVIISLGKLGDKKILPKLFTILEQDNILSSHKPGEPPRRPGEKNGSSKFRRIYNDTSANIQYAAIQSVTLLADSTQLIDLLFKGDKLYLRRNIIKVISSLNDRNLLPHLYKMMDNRRFMDEAIRAIVALDDRSILPQLRRWLRQYEKDKSNYKVGDIDIEYAVLDGISKMGDQSDLEYLIKRYRSMDRDRSSSWKLINAIMSLLHKDTLHQVLDLINVPDDFMRLGIIMKIGEFGDSQYLPLLYDLFKNPDEEDRGSVLHAIVDLSDNSFLPTLIGCLKDVDSSVRSSAAYGMGKLGEKYSATFLLLPLLNDEDEYVRRSAFEALMKLEGKSSH